MKIIMVNHSGAENFKGGDSVQIRETTERLCQRGHQVAITNTSDPNPNGFDLVHIFNCREVGTFENQVESCKLQNIPVVVSPIWISIPKAFWGSRASFSAIQDAIDSGNEDNLERLKERALVLDESNESFYSHGIGHEERFGIKKLRKVIQKVDGLLPNSLMEMKAIREDLLWKGNCFNIANYGVNPKIFLDANPKDFVDELNIKYPFVLQAGRIEPAKNQAMLCWALRKTNIPIVLIGSSDNWPAYGELCKQISGKKLTIIDHLPQKLLASAYAAASAHILPSWCETCGLVSLEAALNNTPVIGSTFGHELEYLKDDALYVDPADTDSILQTVLQAIDEGKNHPRVHRLKKRVISEFNWEKTTDSTIKLYSDIIKSDN
tara:strand:+ start:367 stop:1503 length:1137 start_codon:yes stop_codon:yes gene_type:complete